MIMTTNIISKRVKPHLDFLAGMDALDWPGEFCEGSDRSSTVERGVFIFRERLVCR